MNTLDKRLNAYRDDLADERLREQVTASDYASGQLQWVHSRFADVLDTPTSTAGLQTQFLLGDAILVFEQKDGWCWVQRVEDGYVGYVQEISVSQVDPKPTHIVSAPRTFLYSQSDLKSPRAGCCSMGSRIAVVDELETRGTEYFVLSSGHSIIKSHVIKLSDWQTDYVAVAETLLHAPYLWGGSTGFGLDCSGLVWLSQIMCGNVVLRDSDMQAQSLGKLLETDFTDLKRGDLVFWKGHVGIMADGDNLLHANGNTMNVALEPLDMAIERIGYLYGQPTAAKRLG